MTEQESSDFYEDDEPTERIVAAFDKEPKELTEIPNLKESGWVPRDSNACPICGLLYGFHRGNVHERDENR